MKKTLKRLLALTLTVMLVLGVMPLASVKSSAATKVSVKASSGSYTYDAATNTLTLKDGFNANSTPNLYNGYSSQIYANGDLNIVVNGTCYILMQEASTSANYAAGIHCIGDLNISGTGTLTIQYAVSRYSSHKAAGIVALNSSNSNITGGQSSVTFGGGVKVNVKMGYALTSYGIIGNPTINDATLSITTGNAKNDAYGIYASSFKTNSPLAVLTTTGTTTEGLNQAYAGTFNYCGGNVTFTAGNAVSSGTENIASATVYCNTSAEASTTVWDKSTSWNNYKYIKIIPISVTGISISNSSLSLGVGGTSTLTATVTPSNATTKDIIWSSSNESVATVSDDGVVTAVGAGTATITATTVDGGKTATCTVTAKSEEIRYFYIKTNYAVEGKSFDYVLEEGYTYEDQYTVTSLQWYKDGVAVSSGNFESDSTYTVEITVACNTGYAIYSESDWEDYSLWTYISADAFAEEGNYDEYHDTNYSFNYNTNTVTANFTVPVNEHANISLALPDLSPGMTCKEALTPILDDVTLNGSIDNAVKVSVDLRNLTDSKTGGNAVYENGAWTWSNEAKVLEAGKQYSVVVTVYINRLGLVALEETITVTDAGNSSSVTKQIYDPAWNVGVKAIYTLPEVPGVVFNVKTKCIKPIPYHSAEAPSVFDTEGVEVTSWQWIDSNGNVIDTFGENEKYFLTYTIEASEGYSFNKNISTEFYTSDVKQTGETFNNGVLTITAEYTTPKVINKISCYTLGVYAYMDNADIDPWIDSDDEGQYTILYENWYDYGDSTSNTPSSMYWGQTFFENEYYRLDLVITPEKGYIFADEVTSYYNDEDVTSTATRSGDRITISYTFKAQPFDMTKALIGDENTIIDFDNNVIFTTTQNPDSVYELLRSCGSYIKNPVPSYSSSDGTINHYGTGSTVLFKFPDNSQESFTLIIDGDLNGDSVCDVLDASAAALYSRNKATSTFNERYAAKGKPFVNEEITALDYSNVVNIALGLDTQRDVVIGKVAVTEIQVPVAGEKATWSYSLPDGIEARDVCWIESDYELKGTPESDETVADAFFADAIPEGTDFTFKPEKYYSFYISYKVKDGYVVNNTDATMNGGGYAYGYEALRCWKTDKIIIDSINLTVTPKAGQTVGEIAAELKAQYSDMPFTVDGVYFYLDSVTLDEESTETLVSGTQYRVYIRVEAKDGYDFDESTVSVSVNGQSAQFWGEHIGSLAFIFDFTVI